MKIYISFEYKCSSNVRKRLYSHSRSTGFIHEKW